MDVLRSAVACFHDLVFRCSVVDQDRPGTRTIGGMPTISCPVAPGPLTLPQDDGCLRRAERDLSVAASKCLFRYGDAEGFDMPMATPRSAYLASPIVMAVGQAKAQHIAKKNERQARKWAGDRARFNSFHEFRKVFIEYRVPPIADRWREDRAWCDQQLAGFDPITIQRVTHDGNGVGKDWNELAKKLNPGVIAAAERADGVLFVADYEELREAGPTPGAVGAESGTIPMAPIALFVRARTHGGIDPVAIQLDQHPDALFYLPDGSDDWMMARSYAQAASYQLTQIVYHLTLHHLIEEAFALTTMRELPNCHPLYALLGHHFSGLMPINVGTINQFFGEATQQYLLVGRPGSERLANARYARWNFWQLDFVADLERRGVDDRTLLPYYPFRDDLMLYWDLLWDYTYDYLAVYYSDPAQSRRTANRNVARDYELQAWAAELSRAAGGRGDVPGLPECIRTFEELHRIVHLLIFTAGPHHASLNYSQIDYGSFVPNMPAATYLLPPEGGVDHNALINLMPPVAQAIGQTTMSHQAQYYMGQLLDYADYFCGCWNAEARDVVRQYRRALLGEVTDTIRARNVRRIRDGALAYNWVLPVNVPNSTSA